MKIQELLDMRKVLELVQDGYIRERQHPEHPSLRTLGYTEKAQWERMWVHETLTCRGLIYEAGSGEVVARPYPKFFNHGEYGQDHLQVELDLHAPAEVTDKMDGSLGIIYRNPFTGEWAVATRGSFDSDQARFATDLLRELTYPETGRAWSAPKDGFTYLAEIIYPDNRIVLDYGGRKDLALLGAVHIETGSTFGPNFDEHWPGGLAEVFPTSSLAEALALPPRPNAEGLVVRYLASDLMVKIKQEDYVRLHKIVTGLSDKAVWEHLSGDGLESLVGQVPDEFHAWLRETEASFEERFTEVLESAIRDYNSILNELNARTAADIDRKEFALIATKRERPHLLFALLTGKPPSPMIWKELKPVGVRYMSSAARDEALA